MLQPATPPPMMTAWASSRMVHRIRDAPCNTPLAAAPLAPGKEKPERNRRLGNVRRCGTASEGQHSLRGENADAEGRFLRLSPRPFHALSEVSVVSHLSAAGRRLVPVVQPPA